MDMAKFHDHHSEVRALIASVERHLQSNQGAANLPAVSSDLVRLFGKFSIHLAIEDQVLYPRLGRDANPDLRRMATRFQQEMGDMKARFETYRKAWPGPTAIARSPADFIRETRDVLAQIKERLDREDRQLYPLAERVAA